MESASRIAQQQGQDLYLVGGVVRDMFLGHPNLDLDLVLEGDSIALAQELALTGGTIVTHHRFGTAKLRLGDFSIDITTARRETYAHPGALPTVRPGTIMDDLCRRDFTVNAMAICLTPDHFGELLDPYQGKGDLDEGILRVLHERSFIDDATRILRSLRYEQRLGFQFEPATAALLKRDVAMLETISADRLRHELELILREDYPERVICRARELGVLNRLHPSLKGDDWLGEKFPQARRSSPPKPPPTLYLALLIYPLSAEENEQFISWLKMPRAWAQILRDTLSLKARTGVLAAPSILPSEIYSLLKGYAPQAILANAIACGQTPTGARLQLFLDRLRYVKPSLGGEDLKRLGVPASPRLGQALEMLHRAKLDGEVKRRGKEIELVQKWLGDEDVTKEGI